ncbi:hypothetical protein [Streptomyces sp. NPDC054784]
MASQIITLIGVLLGAITSFLATTFVERARFRQALVTRWDERKLSMYIEYASCVKDAVRTAKQALEAHDRGRDNAESLANMEAAESRRSVSFEGLVLLADEATAEAAKQVNERLWRLLRCAREPADFSASDRRERGQAIIDALNQLHEAARSDLLIGKSRL